MSAGSLRKIEHGLLRVEGGLAVATVVFMLVLAAYNIVYRNILVPIQRRLATSGPPPAAVVPVAEGGGGAPSVGPGGEGAGAGGFEGGFGAAGSGPGGAGGFEGGFGAGAGPGVPATPGVADGPRPAPPSGDEAPVGGPPPPGSAAARAVAFIDAIKLDWIDVVLRQGVILLGFLGAAFATCRRKHINIDALSKILPARARAVVQLLVDLLSLALCLMLAAAGRRLVAISLEFPKELVSWADEWVFQLMFPVGFSVLAFHFSVRVAESARALGEAATKEVAP